VGYVEALEKIGQHLILLKSGISNVLNSK